MISYWTTFNVAYEKVEYFADIVSSLSKQLLSVTTPGGSGGVEDQTNLLGF